LESRVFGRNASGDQGIKENLGIGKVGAAFAIVPGSSVIIVFRIFSFRFIPLELTKKPGCVPNHRTIGLPVRLDECHHIDRSDIVLKLDFGVGPRNVARFGVDQRLNISKALFDHRVIRRHFACSQETRYHQARDPGRQLGTPRTICQLAFAQKGDGFVDLVVPEGLVGLGLMCKEKRAEQKDRGHSSPHLFATLPFV
jgi:hypothetical protein